MSLPILHHEFIACRILQKSCKMLAWCLLMTIMLASAQMGMPGMGKKEETKAPAVKQDIQFIRCQTCEAVAKQAFKATKQLRDHLASHQRLQEADILDMLEKMCNPDTHAGEWITQVDLVEEGTKLKLVDQGVVGECGTECRTVARACEVVMDSVDMTELSEILWAGTKQRAALANWLCYEATDVCLKKPPPLPETRKKGPRFKQLSEEEVRHKKLLRSMKDAGLSGTLYDREKIAEEMERMKAMGLDYESFDDDEEEFEFGAEQEMVGGDSKPVSHRGATKPVAGLAETAVSLIKNSASGVMDNVRSLTTRLYSRVFDARKKAREEEL